MASLATLQTERDRLRAISAKDAFDAALAATVVTDSVVSDSVAVRKVLHDALAAMVDRFITDSAGICDETEVHQALSESAHGWLSMLGNAVEKTAVLHEIGDSFRRGVRPRDLITVAEWADRYRELKSGTNAPGPWRTSVTPYLAEIMECLSEHSKIRQVTFIKSSGVGGPLALDTPIPTPEGFTTMGEIRVGQMVFDENGQPCEVLTVSPVFAGRRCYAVFFSDHEHIVCDESHLWTVHDRFPGHAGKKRGERRLSRTMTTGEMAGSFLKNGRPRYRIPCCKALDMPNADLPIPPYVFGYWLANGNISGHQMAAHEADSTVIAALNVTDKNSIPRCYLRASAVQRAELLRGLMDGDGSISAENGRCEFSTVSESLCADVIELIRSLGLKPVRYDAPRRGFTGKNDLHGRHWRIRFIAYDDFPVFKLARKRALQPARGAQALSAMGRYIIGVFPVESTPVRCIGVDSPSHLYLCGNAMIATHNTEAMFNWIGYVMHHLGNRDLLVVLPTLELRDRSFNPRLSKMLDESPSLSRIISRASRNKANRGDLLEYGARARIIKAGANSPDSLRSDHLAYVICDEVDAFPWDVGGEGDPMTLIENRQRTFSRAKTYLVSTPTKEGQSRITQQYERSDKRRYHVPCPHCNELQPLEFGGENCSYGLKFRRAPKQDGDDGPEQVISAQYLCKHCGALIDEVHKTEMLAKGRWIPERPWIKLHRGYHINALYAPAGLGLGWKKIAQKWMDVQGDSAELKAFFNTYLGEVFKETGDSIEDLSLISRVEVVGELSGLLMTAGVDVQKDRIEASIVAWGKNEEAWVVDHLIIPGDTAQDDVWGDLASALDEYGIKVAAIDSGYNATQVYAFVQGRRHTYAVKGVPGMSRPIVEDERARRARLRRRKGKGFSVEPVGVDGAKSLLYSRLKISAPGPGYIHFVQGPAMDDEYFAQLAAEKLVTRMRGYRPFSEWVKLRSRNEALDCLVYALAAMRLTGISPSGLPPSGDSQPAQTVANDRPLRRSAQKSRYLSR